MSRAENFLRLSDACQKQTTRDTARRDAFYTGLAKVPNLVPLRPLRLCARRRPLHRHWPRVLRLRWCKGACPIRKAWVCPAGARGRLLRAAAPRSTHAGRPSCSTADSGSYAGTACAGGTAMPQMPVPAAWAWHCRVHWRVVFGCHAHACAWPAPLAACVPPCTIWETCGVPRRGCVGSPATTVLPVRRPISPPSVLVGQSRWRPENLPPRVPIPCISRYYVRSFSRHDVYCARPYVCLSVSCNTRCVDVE